MREQGGGGGRGGGRWVGGGLHILFIGVFLFGALPEYPKP